MRPHTTGTPSNRNREGSWHLFEIDIGGEEEVQMPVAIVVQERAARAPERIWERQTSFVRDVGKGTVAVVAE